MNKEISKALIGIAGGAVLLGFQPGAQSAISAGGSLLSLGLEFHQLLRSRSPESQRALARIRKKLRSDFLAWSQVERLDYQREIDAADASLMGTLPTLLLSRDRLISAAFKPTGFVDAAAAMMVEELARVEPLFEERAENIARRYAESVIKAALNAVFTERAYFEALQPFISLQSAQGIGEIDRKVDRVLALMQERGGLSQDEVRGLLTAFFEEHVPEEEAGHLLLEKAKELRALRLRVREIESVDATLSEGLSTALAAMDKGQYAEADATLSKLVAEGVHSIGRTLITTVKLLATRGELAGAQAKYSVAAKLFERAAGVARVFDEHFAWELVRAQAGSLMEHALMTSGTAHYKAAIGLALQRTESVPKTSVYRIEAISDLIPMAALFAERVGGAEGREAVLFGVKLGRKALQEWNPDHDIGLKVSIGNSLGALLNAAVEMEIKEEGGDIRKESVAKLRETLELATLHAPEELPVVRMNLATALRRAAEEGAMGVPLIREAVEQRLAAVAGTPPKSLYTLANAYDSLGNDYRTLATAEGRWNSRVFFSALSAHHRGLQLRSKGAYSVEAAKSCLNIGALYMSAAKDLEDAERTRLIRLAIGQYDRGLRLVTQEGAPSTWLRLCHTRAAAKLQLVMDGDPFEDSDVMELGREFASLLDCAHRFGDITLLVSCAHLSYRLSVYIYMQRRCALASVVEMQETAFWQILPRYEGSDLGVHLEMWIAEAGFIVADLRGNLEAGTNALERARGIVSRIGAKIPSSLTEMRDVVADLEENFDALRRRVQEEEGARQS